MRLTFSTLSILAFGLAALTSMAQAGTMKCSDANRTVEYTSFRPDGGANRENDINWVINGVHLMEESSLEIVGRGGQGFSRPAREVSSEFSLETVLSTRIIGEQYNKNEITSFISFAKVSKLSNQELVYEGYLICESVKYIGIPRP